MPRLLAPLAFLTVLMIGTATAAVTVAETIASVGLGLVWNPIESFFAEFYWGNALDDQNLPDDSWQDRGFHYQVSYQAHF